MARHFVTLLADEDLMAQIVQIEKMDGVEIGTNRPSEGLTDAVDSPLGPEEIKAMLQLVTVAFTTASAAVVFLEKVKKLIGGPKPKDSRKIRVKHGKSGANLGTIDSNTDVKALAKKLIQ